MNLQTKSPGVLFALILAIALLEAKIAVASDDERGYAQRADVQTFIAKMNNKHGFERKALETLFNSITVQQKALKLISNPAEKSKTWDEYRALFVNSSRINAGLAFARTHAKALAKAEQKYRVPKSLILAIIGVETRYGRHMGRYRVLDAISTLAFDFPRRSRFFKSELEAFLLLSREKGLDPSKMTGSYAGAMGYGQFIPSSYRRFAVDFDGDRQADLRQPTDAIGSVANYIAEHGWKNGKLVVAKTSAAKSIDPKLINDSLKPKHSFASLHKLGLEIPKHKQFDRQQKATLIGLKKNDGSMEFWLGAHNFYVITRYNHSRMYAMAVWQLAEALEKKL